ncbi:MAG: hypothetical protein NT080_11775 [Spirochaetes bacterium]|nr:hypothetical protein [Spirochaetota bacterium]
MKHILAMTMLLASSAGAFAQESAVPPYLALFPDIYEARLIHTSAVLMSRLPRFLQFQENVQETRSGRVLSRVEQSEGFAYAEFLRERDGEFPLVSAGNTILQRETVKGFITCAKIFLNDDPSCYIRYSPISDRSKFDVVVYGAVVRQELITGLNYILQFGRPIDMMLSAWNERGSVFRSGAAEGARERFVRSADAGGSGSFFEKLKAADPGQGQELAPASWAFYAADVDPRATNLPYAAFPKSKIGMPLAAVRAAIFERSSANDASRSAAVAYVATSGDLALLFIPHVGRYGTFEVAVFALDTRKRVDMTPLLAARGTETVTVREVALP